MELTENEIVACNILSNGHYELIANFESFEENNELNAIFTIEIAPDGTLVKETVVHAGENGLKEVTMATITYEYGNANVELIEELLEEAKEATVIES